MSRLTATIIDVGWGDSIFLVSEDANGQLFYGLIDSNDTTNFRSSFIFLKKYFERNLPAGPPKPHTFDFVLLTHPHADHAQGLKPTLRFFGARSLWYPKSAEWSAHADLIRFASRSTSVSHHQSIDDSKMLKRFGDAKLDVLWPPYGKIDKNNENNNSVVLLMQLKNVAFVFGGDAEAEVWDKIASKIPSSTLLFKVPHHGSTNGTFDTKGKTPWLSVCPKNAALAISAHNRPFGHPDKEVIDLFQKGGRTYYRTDDQYHLSCTTDGAGIQVKHSHY